MGKCIFLRMVYSARVRWAASPTILAGLPDHGSHSPLHASEARATAKRSPGSRLGALAGRSVTLFPFQRRVVLQRRPDSARRSAVLLGGGWLSGQPFRVQ